MLQQKDERGLNAVSMLPFTDGFLAHIVSPELQYLMQQKPDLVKKKTTTPETTPMPMNFS